MIQDFDKATHTLWNLTPSELLRLQMRADVPEDGKIAISLRWEEAAIWHYDNRDVQHFVGNPFDDWLKAHPVYGPVPPPPVEDDSDNDYIPF